MTRPAVNASESPSYSQPQTTAAVAPTQIDSYQSWATAQLQYMGLPVTTSNVQFLASWAAQEGGAFHNTAYYNPLNTTLQYAGSTVMGGGNSAGVQAYGSWADGLAATAQTLDNGYSQIIAALQSGDAMAANESGSLAADLSKWSGGGYSSVGASGAISQTYTGGGNVYQPGAQSGSSGTPTAQGLSMSDIPAVKTYIQQNWPDYAWMLNIPEVATILEQGAVNGESTTQVQASISQTNWWKSNSSAVRQYQQNLAQNPGDYNFNVPGSLAQQELDKIMAAAAATDQGAGVQLSAATAHSLATQALQFGWTDQQIQQAIGAALASGGASSPAITQQLNAAAGQYLMDVSPQVLQSWADNIAAGTQTTQQFQAYLAHNASLKWTGMASQIQQGYTPYQITDSLRTEAAKTMEVDPTQIDFVNNPMYSKILDYVPPSQPGQPASGHRMMTLSEMDQYLKSQPAWGYTQNARDSAAQLESTLLQTWGKVAPQSGLS